MYLTVLDGIVNIYPASLGILGPAQVRQHYVGNDTSVVDVMIAYLPSLCPAEELPSRLQDVVRFARPYLHNMKWALQFIPDDAYVAQVINATADQRPFGLSSLDFIVPGEIGLRHLQGRGDAGLLQSLQSRVAHLPGVAPPTKDRLRLYLDRVLAVP
jgi:hypothetical protein